MRWLFLLLMPVAQKIRKVYWFLLRPKTHGVLCLLEWQGKVLLVQHTYIKNFWAVPGGGVKSGEAVEDACRRELREEVGIEVGELHYLGQLFSTREFKKDMVDCFWTEVGSGNYTVDMREIFRAEWFEKNSLPKPLSAMTLQILRMRG
jgi:NAD+ diphosphatase